MDLGQKIRGARLAAGLSQRQLCGEEITRNMLSQIENGSARPSMDTLRYLAGQLGKPVSYFLEEDAVTSPNQAVMARARDAYGEGRFQDAALALAEYRGPDPVFDAEQELLFLLVTFALAEEAMAQGRYPYAGELLDRTEGIRPAYCARELEWRRLLLMAQARTERRQEICRQLPSLDEELLLRARAALDGADPVRCAQLLGACGDREAPDWNFLRGECYLVGQNYAQAAACYHKAEEAYPEKTAPRLERCYRELEDYKQAYFYACKQR